MATIVFFVLHRQKVFINHACIRLVGSLRSSSDVYPVCELGYDHLQLCCWSA